MDKKRGGFTIIEVMIVLAIVGLIMLIVFLAIPSLQRNVRNHQRKTAVQYVWTQMHEYFNTHNFYPLHTDHTDCSAVPDCVAFRDSLTATASPASNYAVLYGDNELAHNDAYNADGTAKDDAYDTVVIFSAHRCQRDIDANPPGSADYPVHSLDANDNNFTRFAVYIVLEHGNAFCLDDFN